MSDRTFPHVCFVSYKLYSFLNPGSVKDAGGAERQQYLVGRCLAERGYPVSAVVGDFGQAAVEERDGFEVHRSYRSVGDYRTPTAALRVPLQVLRLYDAMHDCDATVFYTRNSIYYVLLTVYAALTGDKVVLGISNDRDVERSRVNELSLPFRLAYERSLVRADAVISQSRYQQERLRSNFGVESRVVPNGIAHPTDDPVGFDSRDYFLWIGRASRDSKRPHLFLEIARRTPEHEFVMIVSPKENEGDYYDDLLERAAGIDNLRCEGFVPPNEVDPYYAGAIAVINTSSHEGFPNTFLEAWRCGTPVVSVEFDIDDLLATEAAGLLTDGADHCGPELERLATDRDMWEELSRGGLELIRDRFSIDSICSKYESIFSSVSRR